MVGVFLFHAMLALSHVFPIEPRIFASTAYSLRLPEPPSQSVFSLSTTTTVATLEKAGAGHDGDHARFKVLDAASCGWDRYGDVYGTCDTKWCTKASE